MRKTLLPQLLILFISSLGIHPYPACGKVLEKGKIIKKVICLNEPAQSYALYFLNKMIEIAGDEQMINMYDSTQSLTAELINFFFYGILTKKSEDK